MSIYRPTELRYQDLTQVKEERALMFNYYNDLIRQYGKDVTYYRREKNFLANDSALLYGHNADPKFTTKTNIRCYDEANEYNFILNGEGFVPNDKMTLYFGLTDFAATFVEDEGQFKSYKLIDSGDAVVSGTGSIRGGYLTVPFATEVYYGTLRIPATNGSKGENIQAEIMSGSKPILSVAFNPFIRRSFTTDYKDGYFSADIYVDYDATNGSVKYTLHGDVLYGSFFSNEKVITEIHPNPGDVIEIDYHTNDMVKEQYEITEQISRKPTNIDGISPFLGKYVFRCIAVRRISSNEDLSPEDGSAKSHDTFMDYSEERAKVIDDSFRWSSPSGQPDSNVYGGYQKADAFQTDISEVRQTVGNIDEIFDYDQFRGEWAEEHVTEGKYTICTFSDNTTLYTDGANLFWGSSSGSQKAQITDIDSSTVSIPSEGIPEMMYLRVLDGQIVFTTADLKTTVCLTNFPNTIKDGFDYLEGFSYKDVGYVSNQGYYIFKNSKIAINSIGGKYIAAFADGNPDPIILKKV